MIMKILDIIKKFKNRIKIKSVPQVEGIVLINIFPSLTVTVERVDGLISIYFMWLTFGIVVFYSKNLRYMKGM